MSLKLFGYYLVEISSKPDWIDIDSPKILTVSKCIGTLHPLLEGCFYINQVKDHKNYQKLLKLDDTEFADLKGTVNTLYEQQKIDFDSRFQHYQDALAFYENYLYQLENIKIVALAVEEKNTDSLLNELADSTHAFLLSEDNTIEGEFIGYDILGYEFDFCHSYLCNGLDKEISQLFDLKTNELGIIQNSYTEVEAFAQHISGMGEPVLWLPFAIYDCSKPN